MNLQSPITMAVLLATVVLTVSCTSQRSDEAISPVVIGYGDDLFQIGELLYEDDFENLDNWVVQIQESDAETQPKVQTENKSLDVLMPGREATIWNRQKFSEPVAIVYNVTAPTKHVESEGIVVRDINSFWHASDPENPEDLFSNQKYTGAFDSYHKQQGYYASTGGRDNTTTRFRRYPREADGEPVEHVSLSARDGLDEFLIQPDQTHTIQLVAYEDVIQYIVDEKWYMKSGKVTLLP